MYGHMFDITIVNNDIEETVLELERAIQRLYSGPQWVPVAWVYWQGPYSNERESPTLCSITACGWIYFRKKINVLCVFSGLAGRGYLDKVTEIS